MARSTRRGSTDPSDRVPQLVVTVAAVLVALTGFWMWWFGDDAVAQGVTSSLAIGDSFTLLVWARRIHVGAAIVMSIVIGALAVQALARSDAWRLVFLVAFGLFLGVGFWAGYTADWAEARFWAATVGSKFGAGITVGDSPGLPDELRRARVHLSIVPAALLIVALGSFWHNRRR